MTGKKSKVAESLCTLWWRVGALEAQLHSFLSSALNGGDWSVLDPESNLNTGLYGSQNVCGAVEKGEISCRCQKSNHDSSGRPAEIRY